MRRNRGQGAEILSGMRDVAVIGFAQETAVKDRERNEVEFVIPVVREAIERSGMQRRDIGFTISGSCDYLARRAVHVRAWGSTASARGRR